MRATHPEPAALPAQVSPEGPVWVGGGLTGYWGGWADAAIPTPHPGKTRGVISKSRLKPKCSRYRREKQMGGEWEEKIGSSGGSGELSPLFPLCRRAAAAAAAAARRDPRPLSGAGAKRG